MKCSVFFTSDADKDVEEAASWYEQKKKNLGQEFLKAIREKIKIIEQNPYLYRIRTKKVRAVMLNKFDYLIYYYIEKEDNANVFAVLHSKRDPKVWKQRKKK